MIYSSIFDIITYCTKLTRSHKSAHGTVVWTDYTYIYYYILVPTEGRACDSVRVQLQLIACFGALATAIACLFWLLVQYKSFFKYGRDAENAWMPFDPKVFNNARFLLLWEFIENYWRT